MKMLLTLRQDIHRIVHLDVHMVAYLGQLVTLRGNHSPLPALDLVGRSSVLSEPTSNDDAVAVDIMIIRFVTLIFEDKCNFGDAAGPRWSASMI